MRMPEYRRANLKGGTYFFTVVTYHRLPILVNERARAILKYAWKDVQQRFPFTTDAVCLMPEHIHCIWTLPEDDSNFSVRWKEIKRLFTKEFQKGIEVIDQPNESRIKRKEGLVWQRRFWEHTIRDQEDLNRHIDYIHYNPVKHGLVLKVADWSWSSFHRYVKLGHYHISWGEVEQKLSGGPEFGE